MEILPASEDECGVRGGLVEGPTEACRSDADVVGSGVSPEGEVLLSLLGRSRLSARDTTASARREERNLDL